MPVPIDSPFYRRKRRTKPFISLSVSCVIVSCGVEGRKTSGTHDQIRNWRRHATMSAAVCGKRSSSIFDELPLPLPFQPHHSAKRSRCGFSPPRDSNPNPNPLFSHLRSLFPQMNQELLERALEAAGNDLDSAIKSLTDLHLEPGENNLPSVAGTCTNGVPVNAHLATEGQVLSNDGTVCSAAGSMPGAQNNHPSGGSEWVELFVQEMMNASDMDDARSRASRALEVLEKSIISSVNAESMQNVQKENLLLKEQMEAVLRENLILKRAVAIQHDRQKEQEERNQEVQQLRQMVSQYQDQVRTLEVNNYALTMHLRQAQQGNSIPGRFHPDVF
ncbi:Ubiquitin system component Cue protein [Rhynchospora pubera]|uniref:Ubiquitin system component Cue protein n=1 Tax=Rhynchospora pubera TaxID=906938 RepID=A0AAV8D3K7_9POAL|nr:Ubiquitin system component Cue protein [Rhynchospora pubera]